jgi:hypothetical protein
VNEQSSYFISFFFCWSVLSSPQLKAYSYLISLSPKQESHGVAVILKLNRIGLSQFRSMLLLLVIYGGFVSKLMICTGNCWHRILIIAKFTFKGPRNFTYYMRNGACSFGTKCHFHHPKQVIDAQLIWAYHDILLNICSAIRVLF